MSRKFFITLLGVVLLLLAACSESKPEPPTPPVPDNKYVTIIDVDAVTGNYKALRCKSGYQPFDVDGFKGQYEVLGMNVIVDEDGTLYPDNKETERYDGWYSQHWISVKMTLPQNVELPVIVVHAQNTSASSFDDQAITPEIGAGGDIDVRLVTDNYTEGVGRITSLTMCLRVT